MMRRSSSSVVIALVVVVVAAATRTQAEELTATITEHGRYSAAVVGATPTTEETSGGVRLLTTGPVHWQTTKTIPCKIGEWFGFTVKLTGLETGREYKLRFETRHPPIKQPDGKILEKSVSEQTVTAPGPEATFVRGWVFEKGYEYELVPGPWTLKVYIDGQLPQEMMFGVGVDTEEKEPA